jgi:hypothetical protein
MPSSRAAWQCTAGGFAAVLPLSGNRGLLAVGTLTSGLAPGDPADVRAEMRSIVEDQAMLDGHEPTSLAHRINAALSAAALGHIDALALVSRAAEGTPPSVVAAGRPIPLVVTPDGLSVPVDDPIQLGPGWIIVLGSTEGEGHRATSLDREDVATATALLDQRSLSGRPPRRTLLAMRERW